MTPSVVSLVPASHGRRALAIYLDLIVLGVPWAAVHAGVLTVAPEAGRFALAIKIGLFVAVELLFHKVIGWSPGEFLLSMHRTTGPSGDEVAGVDTRVKSRESWLTLLAGTLFLLEGCKGLVRWSMGAAPLPLFGQSVSEPAGIAVYIASGLIECVVAFLIFRVNGLAVIIGAVYLIAVIGSVWMSWDLLPDWAAESFRRRLEYQGREVTPEALASARRSAPVLVMGSAIGFLALLLLATPWLLGKGRDKTSGAPTTAPTAPR